ncbi:hypothetical protein Bsel_0310 [[Bacillus] selenitireducens MLS10]|uniref:Uncharacterized protein n=1 Tax=Bacillus selenitireducens (strain ATCC 700615 / DSM 15326 / MLS10) TaxID=439292 RepID=D6XWK8_BACIE|nr:hypothetical protein Bsel_0310 [[Bacillus] selenitireducens MLS10]
MILLKSLFLVGTGDVLSFSHLHHPSEEEQFFLSEETTTQYITGVCYKPPLQTDREVVKWWVVDA